MITSPSIRNTVVSCFLLAASATGHARETPFNPDHLAATQWDRVSQICTTVLGLSPNEALEGGYRMGDERLDYWTSHYRGCVVSLSESLRELQLQATDQVVPAAANGPFTYASVFEAAQREHNACAALGLNLSEDVLHACVNGLSRTFYSVEHPIS